MPIFLLFIGLALVISGTKGTTKDLAALVKEDFAPTNGATSFGLWVVALLLVGGIGYVQKLRGLSNAFLTLVFVGLMLSNSGFFKQFTDALKLKV